MQINRQTLNSFKFQFNSDPQFHFWGVHPHRSVRPQCHGHRVRFLLIRRRRRRLATDCLTVAVRTQKTLNSTVQGLSNDVQLNEIQLKKTEISAFQCRPFKRTAIWRRGRFTAQIDPIAGTAGAF
jgi:hypothetical protein